ncbi:MAG: hypothetical protein IJU70_09815 [Lentisphaeria bacterium]|nr:hypothetical protein [Lentisphaeria bacterium]
MKKQLMVLGGVVAAVLLAGCAGVGFSNGAPVPVAAGPNFFSNVKANAFIQPAACKDYTVVKRNVTASAKLQSYFTCVNIGDISYETLKAEALKNCKGANDLVEVKMDYDMNCICGINTITAKLTATAVARK